MFHFEMYKDSRGEFRWRFRASNGKILAASSEGYKARADCEHAIDLLKRESATSPTQDLVEVGA